MVDSRIKCKIYLRSFSLVLFLLLFNNQQKKYISCFSFLLFTSQCMTLAIDINYSHLLLDSQSDSYIMRRSSNQNTAAILFKSILIVSIEPQQQMNDILIYALLTRILCDIILIIKEVLEKNICRYRKKRQKANYTEVQQHSKTKQEKPRNLVQTHAGATNKQNIMKVKQSLFTANTAMDKYFDEYDHYNFDRKFVEPQTRKGRSKRESEMNTNRHVPAGHERKVSQKLQNAEKSKSQ